MEWKPKQGSVLITPCWNQYIRGTITLQICKLLKKSFQHLFKIWSFLVKYVYDQQYVIDEIEWHGYYLQSGTRKDTWKTFSTLRRHEEFLWIYSNLCSKKTYDKIIYTSSSHIFLQWTIIF